MSEEEEEEEFKWESCRSQCRSAARSPNRSSDHSKSLKRSRSRRRGPNRSPSRSPKSGSPPRTEGATTSKERLRREGERESAPPREGDRLSLLFTPHTIKSQSRSLFWSQCWMTPTERVCLSPPSGSPKTSVQERESSKLSSPTRSCSPDNSQRERGRDYFLPSRCPEQ